MGSFSWEYSKINVILLEDLRSRSMDSSSSLSFFPLSTQVAYCKWLHVLEMPRMTSR
ncbi:hypothetical protein [uncultured Dubosiella sp.]|uniref:hypothetical protein n=1 Tax=uncultured Dubosiella sp. TaxID=1937011 RepID=UPI00272D11E9|nr:hypothetical protein [uncultured Dubosiella sp.]